MRVSTALVSLICAVAVTGVYHAFFRGPARQDQPVRADGEDPAESVSSHGRSPAGGAASLRRLINLEARLAALEGQTATGGAASPWTARDLEQLHAMMEVLREKDRVERSTQQMGRRLAPVGLSEERLAQVAPLILRYTDSLLASREAARTGTSLTERFRGAREAHSRMRSELEELLPAAQAQEILRLFLAPTLPKQPVPKTDPNGR